MRRPRFGSWWLAGVCVALGLAACAREASAPPTAPEQTQAPVVYGDDDRTEWYAVSDADKRELTRSAIAAMVPAEDVYANGDGTFGVVSYETLGASNALCANQRFYDEPTASICSGTLIDDRLLMTAGHCVTTLADCASYAWVFDYRYEADGHLAHLTDDSIYHCVDLVTVGFDDVGDDYDFAIVELDRPVVDRTPALVRRPGPVAQHDILTIIGFPNGIPMKLAGGGSVVDARGSDDNYFIGAVDAFYGNSGSGVFDSEMKVTGILVTGADDYVDAGSCNVVQVLDPADGEEAMTYAYRAVKSLCDKGYPSAALCEVAGEASCGDGWCTGDETPEGCPGDCDGLFAVPAEWTCNAGWYHADDGCDCDCGAVDPDCAEANAEVFNCAPESGCTAEGKCQIPIPESWICLRDYYAAGDDCDCDCGAYDPDCDDPQQRVVNCARGSACNDDGTCEVSIPPTWVCSNRWYAAQDGCDCDCGAIDPDCSNPAEEVSGCAPGSECKADGTCEESIPASWVCRRQFYGAGDECDCNCGAPDPDCQNNDVPTLNCGENQMCSDSGTCRDIDVSEPDTGPEVAPEQSPEEAADTAPEAVAETVPEVVEEVAEPSPESGAEVVESDKIEDTSAAEKVRGNASGDGCASGGVDVGAMSSLALGVAALLARRRRQT